MKHKYILEGIVAKKRYYYSDSRGLIRYIRYGREFSSDIRKEEDRNNDWLSDYQEYSYSVDADYHFEKFDKIYEGEIENPPFQEGEIIRIYDTQEEYTISKVMRDTEGNYIYQTNTVIEIICDEESEESKGMAIQHFKNQVKRAKEEEKHSNEASIAPMDYREGNWFTRLFR